MRDFLFDTNHITAFFNKNTLLAKKVRSIPAERKYIISKTVRGELEAGHRMSPSPDPQKIAEFWEFVNEKFYSLERDLDDLANDTSRHYGDILGRLHQKHPKPVGKKAELWLKDIGVQVNDVWLVAEAWNHKLICVTHDGMDKIKEVIEEHEVRFEDWLADN